MCEPRRQIRTSALGLVLMLAMMQLNSCQSAAADQAHIVLTPVASGLRKPTSVTHAGDGSGRLFVTEQDGRIILLEDVAERPYRLDRALVQLRQAGVLAGAAGLAFGTFATCVETAPGRRSATAREVMARHADELGIPAVWDLPLGHGPGQRTVQLAVPATLDGDAGTLQPH